MTVYVLWHIHELHDDYGAHDEEKLIGIYSTEEKAAEAIEAQRKADRHLLHSRESRRSDRVT